MVKRKNSKQTMNKLKGKKEQELGEKQPKESSSRTSIEQKETLNAVHCRLINSADAGNRVND